MTLLKQFDFKKNWSTYIILSLALGAMLFFGVCNPQGFVEQLDNVAGSVDGEDITQAEFSRAYASESERARQHAGDNAADLKIAGKVLDSLIDTHILYIEAKKLGLLVPDDEVIAYLGEIRAFRGKDGKFSDEVFHNYLRGNRYSEATFMEDMRRSMTVDKLRELIAGASYVSNGAVDFDYRLSESKMSVDYIRVDPDKIPLVISSAELQSFLAAADSAAKIKDYYDSHQGEYHSPEKVRARHILVSYKEGRSAYGDALKRSKEEAKKRAEAILAQVKAPGADFAAIAKKETDEPPGKDNGGDLGYFSIESMVKEFGQAAFALKPGEIGGPVESVFGYHVILSMDKKPAVNQSLEQVKNAIAEKLIRQSKVQLIAKDTATKILADLKDKKPIDDLLKSIAAQWKTTDEFALNTNYIPGVGNNMKLIESILKLREESPLVAEPIEVQKNFFIVRLHARHIADTAKLDTKKREQMVQTMGYRNGYMFFQKFQEDAHEKYEKRKAIYRNPQYLALDNAKTE